MSAMSANVSNSQPRRSGGSLRSQRRSGVALPLLGTVMVTIVLPEALTVAPVTEQVTFGKVLDTEQPFAPPAKVTMPLKLLCGLTVMVADDEFPD